MRRVYFDNHVYDLLIQCPRRLPYDNLMELVRTGRCEVYGSLATLEELGGVAGKNTSRYRDLIDCFWSCVRTNVLLDRALLLQAELAESDRLAMTEACFARSFIDSKIKPASYDEHQIRSISTEVLQQKQHDAQDMNRTFEELEHKMRALIEHRRRDGEGDVDAQYERWMNGVSAKEIQSLLDTYRAWNRVSSISYGRAPCTSALIAWIIARAKMNLLHGKQYERSAGHDRDHFIFAGQTGTLVTGDKELAKTIRFIQPRLAAIESPHEFLDWVLGAI